MGCASRGWAVILRLGAGKAAGHGCGSKATLLDRAARAGLPVPPGVLVLDEAWRFAIERGLVRVARSGARRPIQVPDPSLLVHLTGLPSFRVPLAIRAAFSSEEGTKETLAGAFVPGLFVDGRRPAAVAAGLAGVWAAAFRRPRGFRRDVIVQEMVFARRAGVARTEREYEDDLVDVTEPCGGQPPAECRHRESFVLPKRRWGERGTEQDPLAARLQGILRGVRRILGEGDWLVEWADDDRQTWIIQLRAATPIPRNETFTIAGHRDILPDPPSRLTTSLIASTAPDLLALYRRFDPRLPVTRPLLEVVHGRPCLNLSLLTEMVRRWGLPTRLVTESIGGVTHRAFGLRAGRLLAHLPVLFRLVRAQLRSVASSARAEGEILEHTESPRPRLDQVLEDLRWLYLRLATEMLTLTAALSGPLVLLRGWGALAELLRGWRGTATRMLEGLAPLGTRASGRPEIAAALGRGDLPQDGDLRRGLEDWLDRFGHHGVYASDVGRPRYREAPGLVLRSLVPPPRPPGEPPRPSWRAILLRPVSWPAERVLRARESLRSSALVGLERLRLALLARARLLVQEGVLPSPEVIFCLDVEEARRLEEGFRPGEAFWEDRQAEVEALAQRTLPGVFRRLDDLEAAHPAPHATPLRGLGLSGERIRGRAWVLREPSVELPKGFEPSDTILVTRAIDPGWLLVLSRVAGVAVEVGGNLSEGSLVLGEMDLPAVTNVRGLTRSVETGDLIELRPHEGVVERLG
jgi:phosphohistidine swiveling domain-containing protein